MVWMKLQSPRRARSDSSRPNRTAMPCIPPPRSTSFSNWRIKRGRKSMRSVNRIFVVAALAAALPGWAGAQAPSQNENTNQTGSAIDQVVDRITQQEKQEVKTIRQYNPLIETYIQDLKPDKEMGMVPVKDHYFLGLTDLKKGVVDRSMLDQKTSWPHLLNPLKPISGLFSAGYVPEGFLEMIFIDPNGFDRQH